MSAQLKQFGSRKHESIIILNLSNKNMTTLGNVLIYKNLIELDLSLNKLSEKMSGNFSYLSSLRKLSLASNSYTTLPMLPLSIEVFAFENNLIQTLPDHLINCKKLSQIDLSHNKLEDISLLKNFSKLTVLRASSNLITDASFLLEITSLMEVNLENNPLDNDTQPQLILQRERSIIPENMQKTISSISGAKRSLPSNYIKTLCNTTPLESPKHERTSSLLRKNTILTKGEEYSLESESAPITEELDKNKSKKGFQALSFRQGQSIFNTTFGDSYQNPQEKILSFKKFLAKNSVHEKHCSTDEGSTMRTAQTNKIDAQKSEKLIYSLRQSLLNVGIKEADSLITFDELLKILELKFLALHNDYKASIKKLEEEKENLQKETIYLKQSLADVENLLFNSIHPSVRNQSHGNIYGSSLKESPVRTSQKFTENKIIASKQESKFFQFSQKNATIAQINLSNSSVNKSNLSFSIDFNKTNIKNSNKCTEKKSTFDSKKMCTPQTSPCSPSNQTISKNSCAKTMLLKILKNDHSDMKTHPSKFKTLAESSIKSNKKKSNCF